MGRSAEGNMAAKMLSLLLLSSVISASAAAQVAAPTGALLPSSSPVLVQWTTSYHTWSPTVDIFLYQVSPGMLQSLGPLAEDIDNNGQAYVSLPRSFRCDPAALYQVAVGKAGDNMGKVHHSPGFKLTCAGGGRSGSLTILKRIISDSPSVAPPEVPFRIQVTCAKGGPDLPVTLSAKSGLSQVVGRIAADSSCVIGEETPAVPPDLAKRGCRWETSYPEGREAVMPAPAAALQRTVVNLWTCREDSPHASPVPGSQSTIRGSGTITEGNPGNPGSGFKFGTRSEVPETSADIRGLAGDIAADPRGGIISMGFCSLDSVSSVSSMITGSSAGANMGECYAVRTAGGKYAALRVSGITGALGGGAAISFDYKFQPSGSSAF